MVLVQTCFFYVNSLDKQTKRGTNLVWFCFPTKQIQTILFGLLQKKLCTFAIFFPSFVLCKEGKRAKQTKWLCGGLCATKHVSLFCHDFWNVKPQLADATIRTQLGRVPKGNRKPGWSDMDKESRAVGLYRGLWSCMETSRDCVM